MELPEDISKQLTRDFKDGSSEAHEILKMFLTDYPKVPEIIRVCRCSVHMAQGDMNKLLEALSIARVDYRDLIAAAEYKDWPVNPVRVRDFTQPFS
jgi:hypothetical protein